MAPLTAAFLALCVLLSSTLADLPQAVDPKLSESGPISLEVNNTVHALVRRAAGHRYYHMFHGTIEPSAQAIFQSGFKPSADGMLGRGIYVTTDIRHARNYPMSASPANRLVLKVRVRVGKVKKIVRVGDPLQKTWHAHGYDTAWVPPNTPTWFSPLSENCVWDPWRVKVMDVVEGPPAAVGRLKSLLHSIKKNHCNKWVVC